MDATSLGNQTITIADASTARANQFTIGRNAFDNANFMKGLVDEVTVYSDVKT